MLNIPPQSGCYILSMPKYLACLALVMCTLSAPAYADGDIRIKGLFRDKALLEIDGHQRLVRKGERTPEGLTLISADSKAAVLEYRGKRSTYKMGSRISGSYATPPTPPSVRIWASSRGMYRTTGSINGQTVSFLVDTGATTIAMNRNEARRLGIDYLVTGKAGWSSTASGVTRSYGIRLKKVRVGDIELHEVDAAVIDGDFPRTVLLGMSFLKRLDMQRKGGALELRRRY